MYDYEDYYQEQADHYETMAEEHLNRQEEMYEVAEDAYNNQQSLLEDQIDNYEGSNNVDDCDYYEHQMYDAQEHYDEYEDYHHLSEEELYAHFEDQPTVVFDSGHYKIKGEIFMSIWFYKQKQGVFIENSNEQNFSDAKSLSNKGLAERRIKVKTKSTKFPTVSGYLKTSLDIYYNNK